MSSEEIEAITEGIRMLTLKPPKGSNLTGRGIFRLPSELRNIIYEYVLADVQETMVVQLTSGINKKHRVESKTHTTVLSSDREASPLNILLSCKQINDETTGMAYSRINMSLDEMILEKIELDNLGRTTAMLKARNLRMNDILGNFANSFRSTTLSHLTSMEFRNDRVLHNLKVASLYIKPGDLAKHKTCNHMCDLLAIRRGLVHKTFHNVRRILIYTRGYRDHMCENLKEGASWLSVITGVPWAGIMLNAFSNLEQIILHRENGDQQSSFVIWGTIYSGPSGLPLGGPEDRLPNS